MYYRNGKYDAAPVKFYREAKQRYEKSSPFVGVVVTFDLLVSVVEITRASLR
jgi:hypothetical protein